MNKKQKVFTKADVQIASAFAGVKGPLTFRQIQEKIQATGEDAAKLNGGHIRCARDKGIIANSDEQVMQTVVKKSKVTGYVVLDADVDISKCSDGVQKLAEALKTDKDIMAGQTFTSADAALILGDKVAAPHLTKLCAVGFLMRKEDKIEVKHLVEKPANAYVLVNGDVVEGAVVPEIKE